MTFGKHIEELVLFIESNIEETEQDVDILENEYSSAFIKTITFEDLFG